MASNLNPALNPNLALVLKTLAFLALVAACAFGNLPEAIIPLLLKHLHNA